MKYFKLYFGFPVYYFLLFLSSPLNSSFTALESLSKALQSQTKLSAAAQQQLQRLLDRAKAEQVSLVRCLLSKDHLLAQWCAGAKKTAAQLDSLSHSYTKIVEGVIAEVQPLRNAFHDICNAIKDAEACRLPAGSAGIIVTPDNSNASQSRSNSSSRASTVMVSPFDSICRGSAGKEMAALLISLQVHKLEIEKAVEALSTLKDNLVRELAKETSFLIGRKSDLLTAAQLSENSSVRATSESPALVEKTATKKKQVKRSASLNSSAKSLSNRPPFDLSVVAS